MQWKLLINKKEMNRMDEPMISECTKNIPCVDCDNTKCWFQGKKESDCPKYYCDNEKSHDCDHCEFIDRFINDMRKGGGDSK